jgi:hypothetical protein
MTRIEWLASLRAARQQGRAIQLPQALVDQIEYALACGGVRGRDGLLARVMRAFGGLLRLRRG